MSDSTKSTEYSYCVCLGLIRVYRHKNSPYGIHLPYELLGLVFDIGLRCLYNYIKALPWSLFGYVRIPRCMYVLVTHSWNGRYAIFRESFRGLPFLFSETKITLFFHSSNIFIFYQLFFRIRNDLAPPECHLSQKLFKKLWQEKSSIYKCLGSICHMSQKLRVILP